MNKETDIETLTRPGGVVPVNAETTAALVRQVQALRSAATFAQYYKGEQRRSEDCLGDIIKILTSAQKEDGGHLDQILARVIAHYGRDD